MGRLSMFKSPGKTPGMGIQWQGGARRYDLILNGGFEIAGAEQANQNQFITCIITSNMGAGVKLVGGTIQAFRGCTFEMNGAGGKEQFGILQTGGQKLIVDGCYFERNGVQADAQGVEIQVEGHYCASIRDNYFFGGVDASLDLPGECNYAIRLDNTEDTNITGNRSYGHILGSLYAAGAANLRVVEAGNAFNEARIP